VQYQEFVNKITEDLKLQFDEVRMDGKDRIYIAKGVTNVSVPIKPMYQEHLIYGYNNSLKNYLKIINDILDTYKFKLDLSNVFPFVKQKTDKNNIDKNFVEKDLFCDLKIMYVSDMGEVFRFVLEDDLKNSNIDFNILEEESMSNLNKMTNIISKLDNSLEIYSLRFTTDYGATLFLSEHIQKQIKQKLGNDILFCMPSASTLLCAKYRETTFTIYKNILQNLIMIDTDVNKISNHIYRRDCNGNYSIVA
jgi:uncharacterized protein YtpQ (UPF0354 family)